MFHEIQYPPENCWGTSGGPGFNTHVIVTDSGQEERVARWGQARRKYDIAESIKSNADLAYLLTFFMAREGAANGFRFKDWTDYASSSTHITHEPDGVAITDTDQSIGVGDGTTTTVQLIKTYTNGGVTRNRTITKPVAGTTVVALDGTPQPTGWTVNTTTGIITFSVAPANGVVVSAGFEYDVPVRFGDEIDGQLPISLDAYNSGSVKIPIIEIRDDGRASDEDFKGGAQEIESADNYSISGVTRLWVIKMTAASKIVILPDEDDISPGGPWFYIINPDLGGQTYTVKDLSGTTLATLAPGEGVCLVISIDGADTRIWYAI
jgi:uncharacterized protein (TIGR02217 family)